MSGEARGEVGFRGPHASCGGVFTLPVGAATLLPATTGESASCRRLVRCVNVIRTHLHSRHSKSEGLIVANSIRLHKALGGGRDSSQTEPEDR